MLTPLQHFRTHVLGTAAEGVRTTVACEVLPGEAEVGHLYVSVEVHKDIFGLKVAIENMLAVEILHGEHNLGNDYLRLVLSKGPVSLEVVKEFSGRAEVHNEI